MEEYHLDHDAPDKPYVTLYRPMLLVVDAWHSRLVGLEIGHIQHNGMYSII